MCYSKKSIDEILDLSDDDYTAFISSLLDDENALWNVDALDDALLKVVEKRPADVERICRINFKVISKLNDGDTRTFLLAYNFNTSMGAAMRQNKIPESKSIFLEGIAFCQKNKHYEGGKSLSRNIFRLFESGQTPHDEALFFLTYITEFYNALDKHQDSVEALCAAALHFADTSAYQSAYRALHDAQQITIAHKMSRSQIHVLQTQGTVALEEGDLDCAEGEFKKCFVLYEQIGEAPPFILKANAALVKLRKEDYQGARDIYQAIADDHQETDFADQKGLIKINLLACCRELGDLAATEDLSSQVEQILEQCNLEYRIEARLVLAKTYFHVQKLAQATSHLKIAYNEIQQLIDQYQRLHYRRGVREQFISRIKCMLVNVEVLGAADNVLDALVLCFSNALLDWFSILGWIDKVQESAAVPDSTKQELLVQREHLIRFGTPFMYGFREKYDDPFEFAGEKAAEKIGEKLAREIDYSLPWREFNDLTSRICEAHDFSSPLEESAVGQCAGILNHRISLGSSFLFSFVCANGCVLIFVATGQYFRASITSDNSRRFFMAVADYQRGNCSREKFRTQLTELQTSLEPTINKIRNIIESNPITELVFVPDQITEGFPIFAFLLSSDNIRSRIRKMNFAFRTCPALKQGPTDSLVTGPCLFISNGKDNLELAEAEKALVKNCFPNDDLFEINLQYEDIDFEKSPVNSAKVLHLAAHSISANAFSDPWFVSTSTDMTKNGIWLESVQREAHKLQFTLVVLNACNTGTTGSWNYFKNFLTHEKVGLSSAFLLNRRSVVVAAQWNVPEIVGFVFSALFYRRMASQPKPARSFILALVDLYELTKESAIKLLREIPDEEARTKRCEAVAQSKSEFPFRDAYCLGMFQFHSLLTSTPP